MSINYKSYGELIRQGNLVAFPTETVYGLGASAWNPAAINEIFRVKGRPSDNPLIVHISKVDMIYEFTNYIPPRAKLLMQKFWPGPLTIIFKKKNTVLDSVTAGLDTVALRMPDHPVALELINHTGPLVAPSANISGKPSPTKSEHVVKDYNGKIPVIDGGDCKIGLESTVINATTTPAVILRPGFISAGEIEQKCGFLPVVKKTSDKDNFTPQSPGTKYSHYAPDAPVYWLDQTKKPTSNSLILLHSAIQLKDGGMTILKFDGDYSRFARELYDWFRKADIEKKDAVYIEPFTKTQLMNNSILEAVKNRIEKAISN